MSVWDVFVWAVFVAGGLMVTAMAVSGIFLGIVFVCELVSQSRYDRAQLAVRHVPPTREAFHLAHARSLYAAGQLTMDELEHAVEHVLAGAALDRHGKPHPQPTLNDALHIVTNVLTVNEIREIRSR